MNQINLTEAQSKRVPTPKEAEAILKYLKAHPTSKKAVPYLMKKYNCSGTSILKIITADQLARIAMAMGA